MIKVNFYNWDEVEDKQLRFAVIVSRYKNKWILAKHKERATWEIPGGHRELGEDIKDTAIRELQEETGAKEFEIKPICIYSVTRGDNEYTKHPTETFGGLFFAEVSEIGELPNLAIENIELFDELPKELTYPKIQPHLLNKVTATMLSKKMQLKIIEQDFTICKLRDFSQVDFSDKFCFIGKTDEEFSLVCSTTLVPNNTIEADDGWRAFRIEGVLDFSLIGILSKISTLLAENGIGIFAVSTYNTDYILTKRDNFKKALEVLESSGYEIKE